MNDNFYSSLNLIDILKLRNAKLNQTSMTEVTSALSMLNRHQPHRQLTNGNYINLNKEAGELKLKIKNFLNTIFKICLNKEQMNEYKLKWIVPFALASLIIIMLFLLCMLFLLWKWLNKKHFSISGKQLK